MVSYPPLALRAAQHIYLYEVPLQNMIRLRRGQRFTNLACLSSSLSSKSVALSSLTSSTSTLLVIFNIATCNQQHVTDSKVSVHCPHMRLSKRRLGYPLYFIVHSPHTRRSNGDIDYRPVWDSLRLAPIIIIQTNQVSEAPWYHILQHKLPNRTVNSMLRQLILL